MSSTKTEIMRAQAGISLTVWLYPNHADGQAACMASVFYLQGTPFCAVVGVLSNRFQK
ncbi:MAG: hypothetical protein IPL46_34145 [Saprospiraceae bacterium]|nr:hypothetical protein [Saprospiraceae bacterium]